MKRDKSKDKKFILAMGLKKASSLYKEEKKVYRFLQEKYKTREIRYATCEDVYKLIEKELHFKIPE